jgi:preprotein translocase subunit SecG
VQLLFFICRLYLKNIVTQMSSKQKKDNNTNAKSSSQQQQQQKKDAGKDKDKDKKDKKEKQDKAAKLAAKKARQANKQVPLTLTRHFLHSDVMFTRMNTHRIRLLPSARRRKPREVGRQT